MRSVKKGFDVEFLRWCVKTVGAGERILRSKWIADEIGCKPRWVAQFLRYVVADGGMVGYYKVEYWNDESKRNITIWRISYAFPLARNVNIVGRSISSTHIEPSFLHSAPISSVKANPRQQLVGGVG